MSDELLSLDDDGNDYRAGADVGDFASWATRKGFDPGSLTVAQKTHLDAAWRADIAALRNVRADRVHTPMYPPGGGRDGYGGSVKPADQLACALLLKSGHGHIAEASFGGRVIDAVRGQRLDRSSMADLFRHGARLDGRDPDASFELMAVGPPSTGSMPTALGNTANLILQQTYWVNTVEVRGRAA